jgi:hypothetical protein
LNGSKANAESNSIQKWKFKLINCGGFVTSNIPSCRYSHYVHVTCFRSTIFGCHMQVIMKQGGPSFSRND